MPRNRPESRTKVLHQEHHDCEPLEEISWAKITIVPLHFCFIFGGHLFQRCCRTIAPVCITVHEWFSCFVAQCGRNTSTLLYLKQMTPFTFLKCIPLSLTVLPHKVNMHCHSQPSLTLTCTRNETWKRQIIKHVDETNSRGRATH